MNRQLYNYSISIAVLSTLLFSPTLLQAQALEEIIVTAQRREQSLQDVPISVFALSGDEIRRQGFKDLDGMSDFTPTVQVDDTSVIGVTISIRGFGTTGNAVTLESAVPIFVDNLHYSRQSMFKTAFMDVEAVEILKGPQPVYFGQNATAGAFNIRSKRPTPEWEGYMNLEWDDRSGSGVETAAGGPITDTLGIRAAVIYDEEGGFLKHIVTGQGIGFRENIGGRLTLQWQPTDQLTILAKTDLAKLNRESEAHTLCWGGGHLFEDDDPDTTNLTYQEEPRSNEVIYLGAPFGLGWTTPLVTDLAVDPGPSPEGCNKVKHGITAGGPYYTPPVTSRSRDADGGHPDVRLAAAGFVNDSAVPGWYERDRPTADGIEPYEDLISKTSQVIVEYDFNNGMSTEWNAGFVRYRRDYLRDNQDSPFVDNIQTREEDYSQWSTELRINSASGGMFEWTVGGFYQIGDLDIFSSSLGAHVRRPQRFNKVWEDQEWISAFGVLTFNFLDNRASIDLGARYSDLYKNTFIQGYGATWIFDERPCMPHMDPLAEDWDPDVDPSTFDPDTCETHAFGVQVDVDDDNLRMYDDAADTSNLWTIPYNSSRNACDPKTLVAPFPDPYPTSGCIGSRVRMGRMTPPNWRGARTHAVGLSAPDFTVREDPLNEEYSKDNIDPQVVMRYRPNDNMSIYARYATAFKAGGFDTGQTSLPDTVEEYRFEDEFSTTYEGGVKGTFMDRRGRYDFNLFWVEFKDLQLSVATPNPDDPFANINAGKQRVQGLEWNTAYAFSDQLRMGFSGALMDGVMSEFPNAPCTESELEEAEAGADNGCDVDTELIDRSGQSAPNTPDWKIVFDLDYWMPLPGFENHRVSFNTKAYFSDGYCDQIGDCESTRWDTHWDANVGVSVGDIDGKWELSGFIKNLNHPTETRHFEELTSPDFGISTPSLRPSNFINYGLRLRYNFF